MNKILIRCDGKDIIINTKRTVRNICTLLRFNEESTFLLIDSNTLEDEYFKSEVVIQPGRVTLVEDITEKIGEPRKEELVIPLENNKGLNELAKKISKPLWGTATNNAKSILVEGGIVRYSDGLKPKNVSLDYDHLTEEVIKRINEQQKNKGNIIINI